MIWHKLGLLVLSVKGAVCEISKLGLNVLIFYGDHNVMVLFGLSCFFRSKAIAPHPTILKLTLTVLKQILTILKLTLTILKLSLGGY